MTARVSGFGAAFEKYADVIKENGVDGEMLLALDSAALKEHVASAMHMTKLTVELRKLQRLLETEARQELSKVSGPMVEWLISINVEERMARKYAAAMKEAGYSAPSERRLRWRFAYALRKMLRMFSGSTG
mgnify:CR=1 FL=1